MMKNATLPLIQPAFITQKTVLQDLGRFRSVTLNNLLMDTFFFKSAASRY